MSNKLKPVECVCKECDCRFSIKCRYRMVGASHYKSREYYYPNDSRDYCPSCYAYRCWKGTSGPGKMLKDAIKTHNEQVDKGKEDE